MERLPPLNALRAFESAGRLLSVTRAAEELCVTPAAVSRHIRLLESHLDTLLFLRGHRGITLTPVGARYLAEISRLIAELRRATASVRNCPKRKVLKLRAPATIAVRWLVPRLASFHRSNPGIEVRLRTSGALLDFDNEDLDGGIELGYGGFKGLDTYRLVANEIFPVCTPMKAEKNRLLGSPRNISRETLLHTLARPDDWAIWMKAAGVTDIDLSKGPRYESSLLAFEAALEGYGVAIAQKALVQKELSEGRLVAPCDISVDLGDFTYYFVFRAHGGRGPSKELDIFRQWVRSVAEP